MAAQTGADGVELDLRTELPLGELSQTAIREIRKFSTDLHLQIGVVSYPTRRGFDDPEELDRRLQGTRRALEGAYQLGARVVVQRLNSVPLEGDPRRDTLLESLLWLSAAGDRAGAHLALEWGGEPDQLASLMGVVGGTLGVSLNPALLAAQGFATSTALEILAPYLLHVRAIDAVRDLRQAGTMEVELGRGTIDFPNLLAHLEGIDYRGWITTGRNESPDPLVELTSAVAYLRNAGD
jgi:sugar phosphate isomerase/epimerase